MNKGSFFTCPILLKLVVSCQVQALACSSHIIFLKCNYIQLGNEFFNMYTTKKLCCFNYYFRIKSIETQMTIFNVVFTPHIFI